MSAQVVVDWIITLIKSHKGPTVIAAILVLLLIIAYFSPDSWTNTRLREK